MPVPRSLGFVLVSTAACSWGTWSLFLRGTHLPGEAAAMLMFAIIGLAGLPVAWMAPPAHWDRRTVALLIGNGASNALNSATFFVAMKQTTVAVAVMTHYLAPVLVAVAAPYVDRHRVPGARVAALVATAGLALVLEPWRSTGDVWVGGAFGTISAVAYAVNIFLVSRLAPRIGPFRTVSYHALIAAVLLLPLAWPHLGALQLRDLALLGAGSVLLGTAAGFMYVTGLEVIGAARAAILSFFEPVVAMLVGWTILGEPLGWPAAAGATLILAAGVHVARTRDGPGS